MDGKKKKEGEGALIIEADEHLELKDKNGSDESETITEESSSHERTEHQFLSVSLEKKLSQDLPNQLAEEDNNDRFEEVETEFCDKMAPLIESKDYLASNSDSQLSLGEPNSTTGNAHEIQTEDEIRQHPEDPLNSTWEVKEGSPSMAKTSSLRSHQNSDQISWTHPMDILLLSECQRCGPTEETFSRLCAVNGATVDGVKQRLLYLMDKLEGLEDEDDDEDNDDESCEGASEEVA